MKVSVVIPIYNKQEYIDDCFNTMGKQTYRDLEIILVDDGSTDESGRLCDEYAQKDPRIVVIHKENGGLVSAWRAGTEAATGEYVCYVDCDDWIDDDMIERLAEHTTGRTDEIVLSDYIIEKTSGTSTPVFQNIEPGEYLEDRIVKEIFPVLWGLEDRAICRSRCMKLFSAGLAKENARYGDYRLRFAEDTSLTIPCVINAGRLYIMDHAAMYHYRYVDDSMVHNYDKTLEDSIKLAQEITEQAIHDSFDKDDSRIKDYYSVDELILLSRKEYVFLLIYAVKNELRGDKKEYIRKIKELCGRENNLSCIRNNPVRINHMSNKLIYYILKKPTSFRCMLGRIAMDRHRG